MLENNVNNSIPSDVITPENKAWFNNMFDFLFNNFDCSTYYLAKVLSSFGPCPLISDEDFRSLFTDRLTLFLTSHTEISYEEVQQLKGCMS